MSDIAQISGVVSMFAIFFVYGASLRAARLRLLDWCERRSDTQRFVPRTRHGRPATGMRL